MLLTVGDLVEDVVVTTQGRSTEQAISDRPTGRLVLELGADTSALVRRRRGGSAANVAEAVVAAGGRSRFVGRVGTDAVGDRLVAQLAETGVDVRVQRDGRTGTIIVLCHEVADGGGAEPERTMLTDRGAAVELGPPDPAWLAGVALLHLPLYSLLEGPIASTCHLLAAWAADREIPVSIDVSATSAIAALGGSACNRLLEALGPGIVFANEAEAELLRSHGDLAELATDAFVEKRGSRPAVVWHQRANGVAPEEIPAIDVGPVTDTTGAGDAFAAGFLTARLGGADPGESARSGHRRAAAHLRRLQAIGGSEGPVS